MIAITAITSVSRFDNTPGIQFVVVLVRSGVSRIFKEAFASSTNPVTKITAEADGTQSGVILRSSWGANR